MSIDVGALFVPRSGTMLDAMQVIDRTGAGIALAVEDDSRLVGTITDGDIRRAILSHLPESTPLAHLLERQREQEDYPTPVTAPAGTPGEDLLLLMKEYTLRQIPLLDETGRVVDIALLGDLAGETVLPPSAVVMAGGFGRRLGPLTEETPKPMLPVGERPLLHRIVEQLSSAGIRRIHLTTHYRADAISNYFGSGGAFGVDISYVNEEEPLGTAGALALLPSESTPLLVMNGDIVTNIDLVELAYFHKRQRAHMTVVVRPYAVEVPYGLVETEGAEVVGISEKPIVRGFVNAGIYLVDPAVCGLITAGERLDMPDLIKRALDAGQRVASFPLHEYWLDIGHQQDYERASIEAGGQAR